MDSKRQSSPPMPFVMPMYKEWVPKGIRPWLYILMAFCFQFSNGMYLGSLGEIRGATDLMSQDVLMCLYASLAGMAICFPMLIRMKFRFTNRQLLCTAAVVMAVCNLLTMHSPSIALPWLMLICFVSGIAKIQGTFECISNVQLWITPTRDVSRFFPVLHLVLLTAIEGGGFLAAWFCYHYTWEMMHVVTVGTMSLVLLVQLLCCRPFCPMPQRMPLRGIEFTSGFLISILMLAISYIFVYGDYEQWLDSKNIRLALGASLFLLGLILYRLTHVNNPYISFELLAKRNVLPILAITAVAELLLGCENTVGGMLHGGVNRLEELTKEELALWTLPGAYVGILLALFWLNRKKWKVWKLIAIGFGAIFLYAAAMYFTVDVNVNIEKYRVALFLRGCACGILSPTLMWSLDESIHSFERFFMSLFIFNIVHMYLAGAAGSGLYTSLYAHFFNDNLVRYGSNLTQTHLDMSAFCMGDYMEGGFVRSMMSVTIKQIYGIVVWIAGAMSALFFLLDIPAVRTNVRRLPLWPVYGIELLARIRPLRMKNWSAK